MSRIVWIAGGILLVVNLAHGQPESGVRATPSGGKLSPAQSAYHVLAYDLALEIEPAQRSIAGRVILTAELYEPLSELVLDLDSPLRVSSVESLGEQPRRLGFRRTETQLFIHLPPNAEPSGELRIQVNYSGQPRIAKSPPWVGGFVWSETEAGQPWIAVACQVDGADLWWPNLDHPLAEPRQADIRITVPEPLVVASNGTLQGVSQPRPGFGTYHWHSSNPINPYNLTINIAPYRTITQPYTSVTGETIPVTFWVLPEHLEKGRRLFPQILQHIAFLEEKLGPYPFRNEKYGVAEVPYLGMEHQTIIGYGNKYRDNQYGFDWLHLHELAHEWWGNMVTAPDWNDFWLHEGLASYMEALYAEKLKGQGAIREYMQGFRQRVGNREPLAPRESRTSVEKYFRPPDYSTSDGDVNFKGAWILHTLRYLVGDAVFFESLRRFAYPTPELERVTDGTQCRFATSDDFRKTVEKVGNRDLFWFFEIYLRQPQLPELIVLQEKDLLHLRWVTPDGLPFPMPVEVQIGDEVKRINVPPEGVTVDTATSSPVLVDPNHWILRRQT